MAAGIGALSDYADTEPVKNGCLYDVTLSDGQENQPPLCECVFLKHKKNCPATVIDTKSGMIFNRVGPGTCDQCSSNGIAS